MKITKRQLRRMIREMHPRAEVDNDIFDYEEWARERGSPPGASSVIASYFVSKGSFSAPDMRMLGDHYGISAEDIQREVSIQRKEMAAGGLSQEVPELTGGRKSSWQVRKEKERKNMKPGDRPGEHKLDFGKDIGTYNYRNEGARVKISRRQLRRIIKEEASLLNETRPRHGIDPREFGRKVIHLRDGRTGIVVAVTRDIILLKSGEQIIPGQVDWAKTNRR
jgi:hypothetical protein